MVLAAGGHWVPRSGAQRLNHARQIADLLEANVYGLTIDEIIMDLNGGALPHLPGQLDFERDEVRRSIQFTNTQFNQRQVEWVWVRTRRRPPNDWVYMAVAKIIRGQVVRLLDTAVSVESYERYYKDWETRTQTLTRMQILDTEVWTSLDSNIV